MLYEIVKRDGGRRFPGMGVLYDIREQISRRNLFPDVIFYEYDDI